MARAIRGWCVWGILMFAATLVVWANDDPASVADAAVSDASEQRKTQESRYSGHISVDVKRRTSDEKWTPRETHLLEHLPGFAPSVRPVPKDQYGGRVANVQSSDTMSQNARPIPPQQATGFFYTKKIGRRNWIIDPEGNPWYSVGCCSVHDNPTPRGQAALREKFGDQNGFSRAAIELLKSNGFNNLGCWSDYESLFQSGQKMPYTTRLNFASSFGRHLKVTHQASGHTGFAENCLPVFHAEFEPFCIKLAKEQIGPLKDDPYLLGHFSDNELPFSMYALEYYLKLPESDPGHQEAARWIKTRGLKREGEHFPESARREFLGHVADTYFRKVSRALKLADPNHMYIGSRMFGSDLSRSVIFEAAGRYVDIVSVNWYGSWTPDVDRLQGWHDWSGRPIIITEWYAKGMDSGMKNDTGAGWTVKTQADRGAFYQNFTLELLSQPGCVGWHWFKYIDNDPTNRAADPSNLNSNKGIVSNRYEPYTDLLKKMRAVNRDVYPLIDCFDQQ